MFPATLTRLASDRLRYDPFDSNIFPVMLIPVPGKNVDIGFPALPWKLLSAIKIFPELDMPSPLALFLEFIIVYFFSIKDYQ